MQKINIKRDEIIKLLLCCVVVTAIAVLTGGKSDLAGTAFPIQVTAGNSECNDQQVVRISPPEFGFYSKMLCYKNIPIKSHEVVVDEALFEARKRLAMMLEKNESLIRNLVTMGNELHIIGRDQNTTDLPEWRHLKGTTMPGCGDWDQCTRGLGGFFASCGEENLLKLPSDRYRNFDPVGGEDICVHEFAHTIQDWALSDELRTRIDKQYQLSISQGLWKNTYAATNVNEFFAELTQSYFGVNKSVVDGGHNGINGREALRQYDPGVFEILDGIYSGREIIPPQVLVDLEAKACRLEGSLRSLEAKTNTSIIFLNRTSQVLQVYWINYNGQRHPQPYATLPPGGVHGQRTFATHPWLIVDSTGQCIAIYIAIEKPGRAVLQERR